jgi:ParB-like chromosome segregation protein Spo0J
MDDVVWTERMISEHATFWTTWLPLSVIILEECQPRNPRRVMFYYRKMKETGLHAGPPISVHPRENGYYAIEDGHHRFLAHILAGKNKIACTIIEEPCT